MNVTTDYLALSWSTSRGRDTYGYNICRLDVRSTDQRFKCMGGGYDMIGTVVSDWLEANYQPRLVELADNTRQAAGVNLTIGGRFVKVPEFYGMTYDRDGDRNKPCNVLLDGGCGLSCMERIAEAIGLSISRTGNRKGHTMGFMVTDYGSAEALQAARK